MYMCVCENTQKKGWRNMYQDAKSNNIFIRLEVYFIFYFLCNDQVLFTKFYKIFLKGKK